MRDQLHLSERATQGCNSGTDTDTQLDITIFQNHHITELVCTQHIFLTLLQEADLTEIYFSQIKEDSWVETHIPQVSR